MLPSQNRRDFMYLEVTEGSLEEAMWELGSAWWGSAIRWEGMVGDNIYGREKSHWQRLRFRFGLSLEINLTEKIWFNEGIEVKEVSPKETYSLHYVRYSVGWWMVGFMNIYAVKGIFCFECFFYFCFYSEWGYYWHFVWDSFSLCKTAMYCRICSIPAFYHKIPVVLPSYCDN